jgi:plastocyanin
VLQKTPIADRRVALAGGLVLAFVLAACGSTASPAASASVATGATPSAIPTPIPSPTPSAIPTPSPRPSGVAFCSVTPDASPSATIEITTDSVGIFHFGDPVTIKVGQAVAFTNGAGESHTITEGTNGTAVADACVDVRISINTTVIVTFYQLGTYQITCRPHPSMQTSVIVQ